MSWTLLSVCLCCVMFKCIYGILWDNVDNPQCQLWFFLAIIKSIDYLAQREWIWVANAANHYLRYVWWAEQHRVTEGHYRNETYTADTARWALHRQLHVYGVFRCAEFLTVNPINVLLRIQKASLYHRHLSISLKVEW